MHIYTYICVHIHSYTCCAYQSTCIHTYVHICTHRSMHTHIFTHMHTGIHIPMLTQCTETAEDWQEVKRKFQSKKITITKGQSGHTNIIIKEIFKTASVTRRKWTFHNSVKIISLGSHETTEVSLTYKSVSKYMKFLEIART